MPTKRNFPVEHARRILEPGPIVLVSSAYKGNHNIMTLGWFTIMEFAPSLIGCVIAESNYSFNLILKSGECVINVPTADMVDTVVKIGNSDGDVIDKFKVFNLTPVKAKKVTAPLIKECFANFECRIHDTRMIKKYNFFIFDIVNAVITSTPRFPQTLHYHGQGIFTTDGRVINKAKKFTKFRGIPTF